MAIYIRDLCSKCINEVLTISSEFFNYTGLRAIVKLALPPVVGCFDHIWNLEELVGLLETKAIAAG
jgi:hypothetical protein